MDDLGKVRIGNTTLGIVFCPSCLLHTPISHIANINFSWYFPCGIKYWSFYITVTSREVNSKGKKRKEKKKWISTFSKWKFAVYHAHIKSDFVWKWLQTHTLSDLYSSSKAALSITSCSCGVIVAGFINKTYSPLSFLQFSPLPVIIFNEKGAGNLMTKSNDYSWA